MAEKRRLSCPICFTNNELSDFYCIRDGCAWWERFEKACSLLVLAKLAVRMLSRINAEGET